MTQEDKIAQIRQSMAARVQAANQDTIPSRTPRQHLGAESKDIISFEHINIHGINSHDSFIELSTVMGILETMEAGIYSVVETQWDTTCPKLCKMIRQTMKAKDIYSKSSLRICSGKSSSDYDTPFVMQSFLFLLGCQKLPKVITTVGQEPPLSTRQFSF